MKSTYAICAAVNCAPEKSVFVHEVGAYLRQGRREVGRWRCCCCCC